MFTLIVSVISVTIAIAWLLAIVWFFVHGRKQPRLDPASDTTTSVESVSVLVPARDEASRVLKESISSLCSQNHLNLEVIVVNDRSTDGTAGILEEIKSSFPARNFKIINGSDLLSGWLGKPNALRQGLEHASGEWILTTDADIIFSEGAIKTAVKYAEDHGYDALCLVPRLELDGFWERVFMPVFGWFCLVSMPLRKVNDPSKKESMGIGNFFLIRRSVLDSLGGFDAIKDDVAEDLKLARLVKESGFRLRVETAPDLLRTRMYRGLKEIWYGFSKNLFSALKFSFIKGLLGFVAILVIGALPALVIPTLILSEQTVPALMMGFSYLVQIAIFAFILRDIEQNSAYAIFIPLGFLVYALILANSMLRILSGRGVVWKGRNIYEKGGVAPPV